MKHLIFSQIDSWFFRESRSMDCAGSTALNSLFPPPNNTLLGAIRTYIGDTYHQKNGTNWQGFKHNDELQNIIGFGNDYANLQAQGAWLYQQEQQQLYFPCPMNIIKQSEEEMGFFTLGQPILCDLGKVRLPQLDREKSQSPLEHCYISQQAFDDILQGDTPALSHIVEQHHIVKNDSRLGIARDNHRRKTEDGKLYQTNHIRLEKDWQLYLGLDGITDDYLAGDITVRLGGEARMATVSQLQQTPQLPKKPTVTTNNQQLVIYLATQTPDCKRSENIPMLPNNSFKRVDTDDKTVWQGNILGEKITIISAITGKPTRIGGWDMVKHKSLPVRGFIPAGSCWYIETDSKEYAQRIVDTLHGQFLTTGNDRALGYGQLFVGIAPTQK
ncbi:MAG: type III-B CRISPR module-associated protein Cmr3 [Gammaproteobacteria bacterium]|nr:type III-B CRISPR module-associated protein Cmr3 [Gammaproteobacteria bacterium]